MRATRVFLVALCLVVALSGCKRRRAGDRSATAGSSPAPSATPDAPAPSGTAMAETSRAADAATGRGGVFTSSDGRFRIRAEGWAVNESTDRRNILKIAREDQVFALYSMQKVDFTAKNIDEFLTIQLRLRKKLGQTMVSPVKSLTIRGHAARALEIDSESEGSRSRELYTVIDFDKDYVDVSIYGPPSTFDRTKCETMLQQMDFTANP